MRTPEHRAHPRAGKTYEADLDMHYLAPGAFTVLPLDTDRLPDPPPAPPPYRLPFTKRHRHQSFAIIGEATPSNPNSRSTSPSGRVSPFKGRGFNPVGSRHVSPSVSPVPPEDPRTRSPSPVKPGRSGTMSSRIPKPAQPGGTPRKSSTGAIFGERVSHVSFKQLNRQGSQSMTSLEEKQVRNRPPPSPRKKLKPAFKQLSPIQGSSPEPSQSLSSPSRIPTKCSSTPASRLTSPTRERSRAPSRCRSRPNIAKSREPSPLSSPTKLPINKYQHVRSRIDSFQKPKPPPSTSEESESQSKKVLSRKNSLNRTPSRPNLLPKTFMGSKHQNYSSDSSVSMDVVDVKPKNVTAKQSIAKVSTPNNATSVKSSVKTTGNITSPSKLSKMSTPAKVNSKSMTRSNSTVQTPKVQVKHDQIKKAETQKTSPKEEQPIKDAVKNDKEDLTDQTSDDGLPSALDVVSSTTNTVTKPLKIETPKLGRTTQKPISPMIDGRVLSATTVSQAINKMNDTVLNTQTLIKDSGLQSRLTSTASSVATVKSNASDKKPSEDVTSKTTNGKDEPSKKTTDLSTVEQPEVMPVTKPNDKTDDKTAKVTPNHTVNTHPSITTPIQAPSSVKNHTNNNSNHHVSIVGLGNAKAIEREVQNNMNKLLGSMDSSLGDSVANKLSANERMREARTVIAADVKPIRITVREKPSDAEVQSGNVGPHYGVANGINERPSLPPSQQHSPPNEPSKVDAPPNRCRRFLDSCTRALTCNSCQKCRKTSKQAQEAVEEVEEEIEKTGGCFKCLSKKLKKEVKEQVRISIEDEDGIEQQKRSLLQKLNCCKKNKVGDTQSCFPLGKRKESWVERRRASRVLESEIQQKTKCCSKEGCRNFFRRIFCCCRRKQEEELPPVTARKESMVSGKKKSLTPTSVPPPEDTRPKIDSSLVEHTSHMKGAIPILPVWLAWFCCVMNCIAPGTGTVLGGMFCLCIGKPRFSQKDGPKARIGAFIIDLIIGFSQFFTVLFCLVGWGWSIWWGVIMVKIAKKHKKLKHLEKLEESAAKPQSLIGHHRRDVERGRT